MNELRNKTPLFLMLASIILVSVLATLKLQHWTGSMFVMGLLTVAGYLVWLISESNVSLTEDSKGKTNIDNNSCELYVFGRLLTVLLALVGSTEWLQLNTAMMVGLAIFALGIGFRLKAIDTLGKFYSHRVRLLNDHEVIDQGPYSLVRHPAYTGMLLAHLGFVIVFYNHFAMLALVCVLLPAIVKRIMVEEVALHKLKGYDEYSLTHKRLIPMVW